MINDPWYHWPHQALVFNKVPTHWEGIAIKWGFSVYNSLSTIYEGNDSSTRSGLAQSRD